MRHRFTKISRHIEDYNAKNQQLSDRTLKYKYTAISNLIEEFKENHPGTVKEIGTKQDIINSLFDSALHAF